MQSVFDFIQQASLILTIITLLATVLVRLTPSVEDDAKVEKYYGYLQLALKWLPTIGVNPNTKKLEETIAEIKQKE
jgi:hypothetical protein